MEDEVPDKTAPKSRKTEKRGKKEEEEEKKKRYTKTNCKVSKSIT